jgi:hypothetical protein
MPIQAMTFPAFAGPASTSPQQTCNDGTLGAARIGIMPGPNPRDERGQKLAAGDQADHEGAQAEALMHVQRQNRKRHADDEKADEDHGHDRQER